MSRAMAGGVSGFEVELRQLVGGGRNLTLHARDEAVDVRPLVASAGHFERPSTNELESGAQRRHGVSGRLTLRPAYALDKPLVVGAHGTAEPVRPLTVREERQVLLAVGRPAEAVSR